MIHGKVDFYSPPSVSVLPLVYQQANVLCVVCDTYFVLHTEINVWIIVLAAKKKHILNENRTTHWIIWMIGRL